MSSEPTLRYRYASRSVLSSCGTALSGAERRKRLKSSVSVVSRFSRILPCSSRVSRFSLGGVRRGMASPDGQCKIRNTHKVAEDVLGVEGLVAVDVVQPI